MEEAGGGEFLVGEVAFEAGGEGEAAEREGGVGKKKEEMSCGWGWLGGWGCG